MLGIASKNIKVLTILPKDYKSASDLGWSEFNVRGLLLSDVGKHPKEDFVQEGLMVFIESNSLQSSNTLTKQHRRIWAN